MSDVATLALASMQQDMARLAHISMNLANAQTPGYKRELLVARPLAPGGFGQFVQAGMAAAQAIAASDNRTGALKHTAAALDLALTGPGYFELSSPQGPVYTRQGSFQIDAQGMVVNAQGHALMGSAGPIVLSGAQPGVDAQGQVFDPAAESAADGAALPVAQIKVVRFGAGVQMQRLGNGLLRPAEASDAAREVDGAEPRLRQGYLEQSNVSSMQEMLDLMQTMRHFEAMQKVAIGHDEMLGAAVRKLGDL